MDREILFKIFKQAIEDEDKAHAFYMKAAAGIPDPEIKKIFDDLAKTELYHSEMLRNEYEKLRK